MKRSSQITNFFAPKVKRTENDISSNHEIETGKIFDYAIFLFVYEFLIFQNNYTRIVRIRSLFRTRRCSSVGFNTSY